MSQENESKHLEQTVIFIPDTGFPDFVRKTDITHARDIIEELLNAIYWQEQFKSHVRSFHE